MTTLNVHLDGSPIHIKKKFTVGMSLSGVILMVNDIPATRFRKVTRHEEDEWQGGIVTLPITMKDDAVGGFSRR